MTYMLKIALCAAITSLVISLPTSDENQINVMETNRNNEATTHTRPSVGESSFRRMLSQVPGRRLGRLRGQDLDTLRQTLMNEDWNQFTPPPMTESNCHVEIQVTQRVPGRCTRLGGRIPACQAQDLVTIDYTDCNNF